MQQNNAVAARPIKVPGPNHPITIERNPNQVVVSVAGRIIADTRDALTLREAAYTCRPLYSAQGRRHGAPPKDGSRHLLSL
jgi:uncharacterized protein (DUF427 family)